MYYLGIDVGKLGGASVLTDNGKILLHKGKPDSCKFKDATEHEISNWFAEIVDATEGRITAAIEKVRSSPQMGVTSAFTFGWGYGFLRGLLAAHKIPYVEPTPQKWQKKLECLSGGDKNITKQKAHQLWPKHAGSITHAIADSLLIAEWLRQEQEG